MLIVEDGSGLATAEAYLSVADADAYFAAYPGGSAWTGTVPEKEAALRAATLYLDAEYGGRWQGSRVNATQALDWGRYGVYVDGFLLPNVPLPKNLRAATAEAAVRSMSGELMPDVVAADRGVTSASDSVGALSTSRTWGNGGKVTSDQYRKVDALIGRLLVGGGSGGSGADTPLIRV
jgi:hypothetical protein